MCCCCPPRCLKFFIFVACILMLGMGAVLIWSGYSLQNSVFMELINVSYAGYIIIACGAALILISFFGCIGAWKRKKFLLFIYILIGILIGILLIAFGAVCLYARSLINDYLGDQQKCLDQFESIEDSITETVDNMCTLYCPCYATDDYAISQISDPTYATVDGGTVDILHCDPCLAMPDVSQSDKDAIISWVQTNLDITISETDCSITASEFTDNFFSGTTKYLALLKWIEESFSCSGFCTAQKFYLFSDINNGKPGGGCLTEMHDWVMENFLIYGIISIIFGIYLVIFI